MHDTKNVKAIFFRAGINSGYADEVFRFRKSVFVDRCAWDLRVDKFGREIDAFDQPSTVYCAVLYSGQIRATFRATRTDRPYLAREIFPQLAGFMAYPQRPDVWEISRFGIDSGNDVRGLSKINYAMMFWFAQHIGASSLVAMADLPYERFLRSIGVRTRRYGPPQIIGCDARGRELEAVAGEIPIAGQDPERIASLLNVLTAVEIIDESDVFGPSCVSA